ncbi:MAG: hypothetical protein H6735_30275 [Alphaproteobacteria bacterium]|nr:hypothetical protein [Alphaproteobacteria bacterium]
MGPLTMAIWAGCATSERVPGPVPVVPTADPELRRMGLEDGWTFAAWQLKPTEELVLIGVRLRHAGCWVPVDGGDLDPCGGFADEALSTCIDQVWSPWDAAVGWHRIQTATGVWDGHRSKILQPYAVRPDGTVRTVDRRSGLLALLGTIDTPAEALLAARWGQDSLDATIAWDPHEPVVHDDGGWHLVVWAVDPASPAVHVVGDDYRRMQVPWALTVTDEGEASRVPLGGREAAPRDQASEEPEVPYPVLPRERRRSWCPHREPVLLEPG